jgi:hypothetical protein
MVSAMHANIRSIGGGFSLIEIQITVPDWCMSNSISQKPSLDRAKTLRVTLTKGGLPSLNPLEICHPFPCELIRSRLCVRLSIEIESVLSLSDI